MKQDKSIVPDEGPDLDLAKRLVDFLNHALKTDRRAVSALVNQRVDCGVDLMDHPSIQVFVTVEGPQLGLLGLLNGVVGCYQSGALAGKGPITAQFNDRGQGVLKQFRFRGPVP